MHRQILTQHQSGLISVTGLAIQGTDESDNGSESKTPFVGIEGKVVVRI